MALKNYKAETTIKTTIKHQTPIINCTNNYDRNRNKNDGNIGKIWRKNNQYIVYKHMKTKVKIMTKNTIIVWMRCLIILSIKYEYYMSKRVAHWKLNVHPINISWSDSNTNINVNELGYKAGNGFSNRGY